MADLKLSIKQFNELAALGVSTETLESVLEIIAPEDVESEAGAAVNAETAKVLNAIAGLQQNIQKLAIINSGSDKSMTDPMAEAAKVLGDMLNGSELNKNNEE